MTKDQVREFVRRHIGEYAVGNTRVVLEGDKMVFWVYGDYYGAYNIKRQKWIRD